MLEYKGLELSFGNIRVVRNVFNIRNGSRGINIQNVSSRKMPLSTTSSESFCPLKLSSNWTLRCFVATLRRLREL